MQTDLKVGLHNIRPSTYLSYLDTNTILSAQVPARKVIPGVFPGGIST